MEQSKAPGRDQTERKRSLADFRPDVRGTGWSQLGSRANTDQEEGKWAVERAKACPFLTLLAPEGCRGRLEARPTACRTTGSRVKEHYEVDSEA